MIGDVAQLGEHLLCKQGVVGSIPIVSTRDGWCVGLDLSRRSVGFGSEGIVCREVTVFLGSVGALEGCVLWKCESGSGASLGVPGCDV